MSDLDILAQEATDLADFKRAARAQFKNIGNSEDADNWLDEIFAQSRSNDSIL